MPPISLAPGKPLTSSSSSHGREKPDGPDLPLPAARRIEHLPPYILTRLNVLNDELRARGVDVIDFGMGNPTDPPLPSVIQTMHTALGEVKNHRYATPRGILPLKEAFTRHYARQFNVLLDPRQDVIMTIGSKDALSHLCLAILDPMDAVVVPTPAYMIHRYAPILAGAHTIGVQIVEEEPGTQLLRDIQEIFERVCPKPKILLLNFPHNPTAKTVEVGFYEEVVKLARHYRFWVINDFAYGHTCFDGYKAPSFLQTKGAREVGVETFTMSKPYNMAGWRVGFMAGNPLLIELLGQVKAYFDYGHFQCIQLATITALEEGDDFILQQARLYQRRRDVLLEGLAAAGWGRTLRNRATMFTWQPLPEKFSRMPSMDFALMLSEKIGVSFSPGTGFGAEGEGFLRMALVESEERIREACARIRAFLQA